MCIRDRVIPVTAGQKILRSIIRMVKRSLQETMRFPKCEKKTSSLLIMDVTQKMCIRDRGETLEGAAEAIWQYNKGIVDAISDLIPAVKPQIAMYEQFGIPDQFLYSTTSIYH